MVTSGWHSLRRLDFYLDGEESAAVIERLLEQALDAIISLPHLESLGCRLTAALPSQLSALSKLGELKIQLYDHVMYRSQVRHLSSPGQQLYITSSARAVNFGVLQELSDILQQFFQGLTSLHLEGVLGHVPPGVMSLRGLQELDMSSCSLNSLPDGPYLRQLNSLNLQGNYFSVVPRSIAACRCLCALKMGWQMHTPDLQFGEGMGRVLGRLTNLTFLGMEASRRDSLSIQSGVELAEFMSTRKDRCTWQQCKVVLTENTSYVACGS